ncbi:NYN domain-containing protein [Novosphingobium profundi]|uniref:NYN domain-containing protein n=1 Tax=Novosphingobium profundi TaxID=1774954 RepID=UPI001BDA9C10|nr:NYN domain-containing protein [Novosphingobium profundi]MBT0668997.1 NYN domain-containing protein [Novosphingobium profundi]
MAQRPTSRTRNIALLIDADNASPSSLESALTILGDLGTVNIRRAYGNWSKPALKGWSSLVHRYALEPQQQFDLTKGKNATDMKMTIDAMDLLYDGHVDGFGLMTSDSDFMPLAIRIRQNGTPVYGFGTDRTPEAFREACTRFIDLGAVAAEPSGTNEKANGRIPQVDETLISLLGDAWRASRRDDDGFASLSEVGQRVANRSSFDARSYGFSRLSELVQSLPNFATENREGALYIKRLR